MLWLHARARFSQARAELGLPDLDTDDEETFWVDAENRDDHLIQQSCRDALMGSLRYGSTHSLMDEMAVEELSRADHVQARALRQKANGLEKVLSAIMDQCSEPPPSQYPHTLDLEYSKPPSSASREDLKVQPDRCLLPNGIRIRLAVGALINILFSRVDDPLSMDATSTPRAGPDTHVSCIPSSLLPLCLSATELASAYAQSVGNGQPHPALTDLAMFHFNTFSRPLDIAGMLSSFQSPCLTNFFWSDWAHHAAESSRGGSISTEALAPPRSSSRDKDLYACGVQRPAQFPCLSESIHHSVRSPIRCTRHLVLRCMTCPIQPSPATSIGSGLSRQPDGRPFRKTASDAKRANGSPKSIDLPHSHLSSARSRLVNFIPLFLQLSALLAIELANESRTPQPCTNVTSNNSITTRGTSEPGSPRLSSNDYIAMDIVHNLERSNNSDSCAISNDGGPPSTPKKRRRQTFPFSSLIGPEPAGPSHVEPKSSVSSQLLIAPTSGVPRYHRRAGPTREWYALLAGLLTRAVLEGYLLKGWKGMWAAETLLRLGLSDGFRREKLGNEPASDIFELVEGEPPTVNDLDPDGLPSVLEAGRILFGEHGAMVEENGEAVELTAQKEFALEMHKRANEVCCAFRVLPRYLILLSVSVYTLRHPQFNRTPRNALAKIRSRTCRTRCVTFFRVGGSMERKP